jgi:GNAT superfamily N-acetyltransferase
MTFIEARQSHEQPFPGTVRPLQLEDLCSLRPILETWIVDRQTKQPLPEEVDETLEAMRQSIDGVNNRTYFVAQSEDGQVVGVMGMRAPDERMIPFTQTTNPVEVVNAFVSKTHRRKGIGKALITSIESVARSQGKTEIILNSGPRYQLSGWGAWKKIFGDPMGIAQDYYGEGGNAPVWRKTLE